MDPVKRGKIPLCLKITPILFCVGAAGMCSVSVSQPRYLEVDYTHEAVTLRCSFSQSGCPQERPTSLWFRYGTHQPEQLGDQERFKVTEDLEQNQVSLTVSKVNFSDSAIYICGIAFPSSSDPRAKQTGGGTELVVRETKILSKEVQRLLVALLTLLSIYMTGVAATFIVLFKSKPNTARKKETEDSQKKKSARRIFQEIAQELYSKRHVQTSQQSS
ncbi:immunoglobulin superfamily member 6 isoform X2 [Erinaceus europaeus]|uniref:immunoglobulin superfamily member 6 isoform X2 n=1 Tax=Erinaceus europaeus TaxID=9365 RepID=UPI0028FC90A9|nr:immunoglobulin superfamily member 6 isoform X2 [Erinaceus europaeus]